ncbi:hypothetical protein AMR41_29455 [Hapalosiphon sp. MRB220]|nr:hypothetical protein AMR41_29455 [Hapalosiphon sp. MRB220]
MELGLGLNQYPSVNGKTLLLDSYSGVEFVYSLARLISTYKGPCIRVRSGTSEVDINFKDNLLDTDSLLEFTGTQDGFLVGWYDQGKKARHAFQFTESLQPKIVSNGDFDSEGILFSADLMNLIVSWSLNNETALLIRESASSITTSNWFLKTSTGILNKDITIGYSDANTLSATQFENTLNYDNPSTNFSLNIKRVWATTYTSSSKNIYLNGNLVASS